LLPLIGWCEGVVEGFAGLCTPLGLAGRSHLKHSGVGGLRNAAGQGCRRPRDESQARDAAAVLGMPQAKG